MILSIAGFQESTVPPPETTKMPSELLPTTSARWPRCSTVSSKSCWFRCLAETWEASESTSAHSDGDSWVARWTARIPTSFASSRTEATYVASPGRALTYVAGSAGPISVWTAWYRPLSES